MPRVEHLTLALSTTLLLAACGAEPASRDAGVDAGPPYVRFAPRVLFRDASVRCAAPPPLEMRPAAGPRPPRGTVRWVYNPGQDVATLEALAAAGVGGLGFFGDALVGMADGGFIATNDLSEFYLGVTADGVFGFLRRGERSRYGATFLMPNTLMTRPGSDSPLGSFRLDFYSVTGSGGEMTAFPPELPGGYPGISSGDVETTGPALLQDGTVVWTTTNRTLTAVCPDGRVRWVLEYYNEGSLPRVFAAADGSIILAGDGSIGIYRIDSDGNTVATRDLTIRLGSVVGFSDRCGVALSVVEGTGRSAHAVIRYYSEDDFTIVSELPGGNPTTDCGVWVTDLVTNLASRYRADGSVGFTYARPPNLELADGSWLMIDGGHAPDAPPIPLGMTIVADDGSEVSRSEFDPTILGEPLMGGQLLTPDGVLFVMASSPIDGTRQFAAIEVGIGRAPTWFAKGTNWSHDNATWH